MRSTPSATVGCRRWSWSRSAWTDSTGTTQLSTRSSTSTPMARVGPPRLSTPGWRPVRPSCWVRWPASRSGSRTWRIARACPPATARCLYRDQPPVDHDSDHVARLRAAGAIPLGKTAAPEFGTLSYTHTKAWGTTRNPWDPHMTPGGSSGGTAAAVAAGLVPFGTASRRRRFDPHPGRVLGAGGDEAQPRSDPASRRRSGRDRGLRRADDDGGRQRPPPGRHRRTARRRPTLAAAARLSLRGRHRDARRVRAPGRLVAGPGLRPGRPRGGRAGPCRGPRRWPRPQAWT